MSFRIKMNLLTAKKIILVIVIAVVYFSVVKGWKDRVKLQDVDVLTLHQGHMTNGRRSAPVPQLACVGGSAGCSAFVPKVVQCYNRGSDGYDIQWECKTDMDNAYRFGEISVNCEGYDYSEDPYILKGSCGLEYTIDRVGSNSGNTYHQSSSYHHGNHHGNYGYKQGKWGFSMSTLIMWGIIACIAYYIYSTCSTGQHHTTDSTQNASQQSTYSAPPPPGFRPEYMQDQRDYTTHTGSSFSSSSDSSSGLGGFWSGLGAGGLAGYLFGSSRGHGRSGYYNHHHYRHDSYTAPGYNRGYGNSWFSGGNSWFGGNSGNTGWFSNHGSSGSTFGSTHRRSSPSSSSSSGSRTASGFGGTKRR